MNTLLSLSLFIMLLLGSTIATAASIQVRADRNPVSLNESFQLIYSSTESVDGDPDFSPLEPYLDILNRSQSSNISYINGSMSSSKTWTLAVLARKTGEFLLPPVLFGSDISETYRLTVKAADPTAHSQDSFYTRIKVDQKQVYAQQQLVITQQLFSDKNLSAYGMGELDFNGMDVISLPLGEEKQYKTRIGDKAYLVIERSFAIFPQTSGLLTLAPVMAEARIGSGTITFFDSLGSNKVLRSRSNALEITVLPVPRNSNVNPWLPASNLQFLEQWPQSAPEFKQGEPITRTLSIKADGLTAAQLPVLPDITIDGLKQYPDQPMLNDIRNDNGITGYRVEKVALIPTRPGKITLPAIDIPWWNTQTQQREVARIPARTIEVQPSAVSPSQPPPDVMDKNPAQAQIKAPVDIPQQTQPPLMEKSALPHVWIILAAVLALGWLLTALAWIVSVQKKHKSSEIVPRESKSSVNLLYKQLKKACDKKEIAECRAQLLLWAQALFSDRDIRNLSDLLPLIPAEMKTEITKMDATLYGGKAQDISFTTILDQAKKMMQEQKKQSRTTDVVLLEPLYK